jgi:hypothetical protein
MLEFLTDNIFAMFDGRVFQQTVGIPMGTNCATLLADLFLYSYEADFIQELLQKHEKSLARSFNFTFRYIYDVLSLKNSRFGDFVDRIYPIELEIKDTTGFRELFGRIRVVFYKIRSVCFTLYEASVVLNLSYINVRECRRTIKIWQSRETGIIGYTRRRRPKQKHNTICVGHHHTQTLISIVQPYEG